MIFLHDQSKTVNFKECLVKNLYKRPEALYSKSFVQEYQNIKI